MYIDGICLYRCRCSSLMLSVNHLAMLAKTACSLSGVLDWVDQSLADVEEHLKVCLVHRGTVIASSSPVWAPGL